MAYSTLTTYASGNVPTAAQLNQASDNLRSLRLWKDYGVHLSLTDDVSIPNSTNTAITWDKVEHQTGDMWVASSPTRINVRVGGRHMFMFTCEWHGQNGGERTLWLEKNVGGVGTTYTLASQGSNAGAGAQNGMEIMELSPGDYVRCGVFHSFGSALNIRGNGKDRTNVFAFLMGVG